MRVRPITVTLGAEIENVDLIDGLDQTLADDLYELLLDRGVLVFRNQPLTPEAHIAFAASFGPVGAPHPLYPQVPGHHQINVIRNDAENPPENESWHTDLSCKPQPPYASVLRGRLIPPVGGDTLWCDLRAVHDALPAATRKIFEALSAEHRLDHGFQFLEEFGQTGRQDALGKTKSADFNTIHPAIVTHPGSQRRVLYVNENFTTRLIGVSQSESETLLRRAFDAVKNPRFQMRMRWQPDTVLIWDNWATQHFASGDHYPMHQREVQRVTVSSNGRTGPLMTSSPT